MSGVEPPRVLADPLKLRVGAVLVLDPSEAAHLVGPLRRRAGEAVVLVDGAGMIAEARVVRVVRRAVEVEVVRVALEPAPPGLGLTLALAVLQGQAMDWAVQKAVELGAARLRPVITDRVQVRQAQAAARCGHWRRLAMQAIKQCRRPWAMEIEEPVDLDRLLSDVEPALGLVADPGGSRSVELAVAEGAVLLVGPEGGLSDDELAMVDNAGWRRLRLGGHVLRADTAAAVGVGLLMERLGDVRGRRLAAGSGEDVKPERIGGP